MTWRQRVSGLGLAALVVAGGACSTHPGLSNGSVSDCYRAIPTAKTALNDKKVTFLGVHRLPEDTVRRRLPASAQAYMAKEDDTVVCAVSFQGSFSAGQVELAPTNQAGSYAIVLITSRHLHLVGAVVLNHLPRSLGKDTV
jgi:hypothetical protein